MFFQFFDRKEDSFLRPYSNLDYLDFNKIGTCISTKENKILYDTYQTFEKRGKRFLEYNDAGKLIRINDYSIEGNERFNYLIEFDYYNETQILCKKILVESNFTHHDELLKNSENTEFTEDYLSLTPRKHNKIIDTVIINKTDNYNIAPLFKFSDDFHHKWMFMDNNSKEVIIEEDVQYSITKEVFYEEDVHIIRLRKYDYNSHLKKKVLTVLKILSNENGKNHPEGYLGEQIRIENWFDSEILDKYLVELELIGTEVYYYKKGYFSFLENDYLQFVIDVFDDNNERIEKGLVISKTHQRSNDFEEKVSQDYILIKRTGEVVEGILNKL